MVALATFAAAACGGGDDSTTDATDTAEVAGASEPTGAPADDSGEPADTSGDTTAETTGASTADTAEGPSGTEPDDPPDSGMIEDPDQATSEGEGTEAGDPVPGGVLRVGVAVDGTGFNTMDAVAPGSARIVGAMNDALMTIDSSGNVTPLLAESMTPSDDLMSWTIKLRPGVQFHDGVAVDAAAVKANLDAFRASPTVGYGMSPVSEITVVDELTVEVALSEPWAAFDNYLAGQPGWMVSPDTIGTNETFVGTGPFMLESWTPGDSARVVRNPNYWQDGMPYLDAIEFKFIPDATVRRQALESGDIDMYSTASDSDILDYLDSDAVDVWIGEGTSNESLFVLNTAAPPMDDLRVRRAIAHALDRDLFVEALRSGLTQPADGPVHPNSRWYAEVDYPEYDPAEAQRLVDEYEAEVGPIEFVIKGEPTDTSTEMRELAMSFLTDVGMDVTMEDVGQGDSVTTAIADDYQMIVWAQFSAYDPDGERSFFRSGGPLNWSNHVSERIDSALDAGRATADFDERYAAYAEWQAALAEELPMIWIDHLNGVETLASSPSVHGLAERVLPDGTTGMAFLAGSFHSYEDIWIEQ